MPSRPAVLVRALLVAGAVASSVSLLPAAAASAAAAPAGAVGHDVSYPQCGHALPTSGSFGVVGVTNGIAFSANPCLSTQWQWASAQTSSPALYTTPANPAPTSSHYWATSGSRDPALCLNAASTTDPGCAYDYGWHAAADALATAKAAAATAATSPWWLDVETGNTYNGDGYSNAADLQGMVDYLRGQGVPSVGFYSTGYQWGVITGGWTTSNDATYRAKWSNEFTPAYPLSDGADWIAGASSLSGARTNCGTSFTGGPTTLAQYPDSGLDGDLVCGAPTSPGPAATVPGAAGALSAVTAASGHGTSLTWTAPASTGGSAITSYTVFRSSSAGGESAYATVSCASTTSCTHYSDTHTKAGRRYYYQVAATNAVGTGARSNESAATAG